MKRALSLSLLGFFLLSLMTSPGFSQKAADILEKMIEAQGGRKVLETIKDLTLSGSVEAMGISATLTWYKKEPNRMRMDMEIMGTMMTQGFDGEISWTTELGSQKPREETGRMAAEAKSDAQGYAAILHPEKYRITYVLKGQEKMEGNAYFVLEQTIPGGVKTTQYVDAKTYLLYKSEYASINNKGVAYKTEMFITDYKKVDGVMVPHLLKIPDGSGETMKVTVTKVSFNTGLEDSLFKMKK